VTPVHKVAVIPGDGIGVEVTAAARSVLDAALASTDKSLAYTELPWGSQHYLRTGHMIEPGGVRRLREFDAILFGACGSPDVPDAVSLWGLRLAICQGLDQHIGYRPARRIPGVPSPLRSEAPLDLVIVRENSEGEYAGAGGRVHTGLPSEVATETTVFTRAGVERTVDFAFDLARRRTKRLASVTKSNAQRHAMVLWDEVVRERASHHSDIAVETCLVDAAAARLVLAPETFDVIVCSNLFGDILSDVAGALMGSLGLAPSGNIDPSGKAPGMFEPVHGSAPDIAGQGIANPVGATLSAALMLENLGLRERAAAIQTAVGEALQDGARTPDIGGDCSTEELTAEFVARVARPAAISTVH
jgi:tartrate dehydrogenase/decarboxylase / D-malate dehydrogenase